MTRKFLEAIEGLSKDAIDKIMQENGNDINTAKRDREEVATKLTEAETKLATLQGEFSALKESSANSEDFKAKFEALQQKIADDEQAAKAKADDDLLTAAIEAIFPAEKKFTSDYVKTGIIADMKSEIAKAENKGKGYTEIFETLTTDKAGIFESLHPTGQMSGIESATQSTTDAQIYEIMGITPPK